MKKGATLMELWLRRDELTEAEFELFFQEVYRVLKPGYYPELKSLPDSRLDYIHSFLIEIHERSTKENFKANKLYYEKALIIFFRNYLKDRIKKIKCRNEEPLDNEVNNIETSYTADEVTLLWEARLKPEQVILSARQFLESSEEWVRLYLARNFCPDKDQQKPLNQLANDYQIPSYHHRARKLGITRKKGQLEKGYEKTLLGEWLTELELAITPKNQKVIEVAFKILCWEALSINIDSHKK